MHCHGNYKIILGDLYLKAEDRIYRRWKFMSENQGLL